MQDLERWTTGIQTTGYSGILGQSGSPTSGAEVVATSIGGEYVCDSCSTSGYMSDVGWGEADHPRMCSRCGAPLNLSLTPCGINYVIRAAQSELQEKQHLIPMPGTQEEEHTYYHGCAHARIVLDWLSDIQNYDLGQEDQEFVDSATTELERRAKLIEHKGF